MAVNFLNGVQIGTPGVYTFATQSDTRPVDIQPFRTLYMFGSSATANAETVNIPTRVSSFADFDNVFPLSQSKNSVKGFFLNSQGFGNLYFINVGVPKQFIIEIKEGSTPGQVTPGTYAVTINNVAKSLVVTGIKSLAQVAADLITLLNADVVLNKEVVVEPGSTSVFVSIKAKNPRNNASLTVTVGTPTVTTLTTVTPGVPTFSDYVFAIQNAVDPTLEAGICNAPEAFQTFDTSGRLSVQIALENMASSYGFNWVAFIDSSNPTSVPNADRALAERKTYSSPEGHSAYYYPYVYDLDDNLVPPSAFVAGIALFRYVRESIAEPPAGVQYPLRGVKKLAYSVTWAEQNVLNPQGVNCLLNKPNYGIVVWGARTMSENNLLVFVSTRVVMNVVINSLNKGFESFIFSAIGSQGTILADAQRKIIAILDIMWRGGLLYGNSPTDSYGVVADATVQIPALLQQGIANAFVWVVPSTILERFIINVEQTEIGGLQARLESGTSLLQAQATSADTTTAVAAG
jgi:hypothetical protein